MRNKWQRYINIVRFHMKERIVDLNLSCAGENIVQFDRRMRVQRNHPRVGIFVNLGEAKNLQCSVFK